MPRSVAVLMDPIGAIKIAKDTTFAMLLEAGRRGHRVYYMEQGDLALRDGAPWARLRPLTVKDDPAGWFTLGEARWTRPARAGRGADAQGPAGRRPVHLRHDGAGSRPARRRAGHQRPAARCATATKSCSRCSFRSAWRPHWWRATRSNFAISWPSMATPCSNRWMAWAAVASFASRPATKTSTPCWKRCLAGDAHGEGRQFAIAQKFIPQISAGDKRILLIDGEPVPYALARIPQGDEFRGNLAAGGRGEGVPLSERDRWIAAEVAPDLRRRGLRFVGLDVIGDYLTEINVTSPTCVRELDHQFGLNIAGLLFDAIEKTSA